MKGGVAIVLSALEFMKELDALRSRHVVVLANSDEELGSPTSRALIEHEARRSDYVLVMEPDTSPRGTLTTSRKGVGRFHMTVRGRASHAGRDPRKGISAVEELARQILELHSLTDHEEGITVNAGVVSGGTRANVVAGEARAEIDLRVKTVQQGEAMTDKILRIRPSRPGIHLEITGGLNRPPMERSPQIIAAYRKAKELGARLGLLLGETSTGGGSDGNFTAALGKPTVDGLGVVGEGPHSVDEYALIESVPQRAALLSLLLLEME
jgi:glutamate carboxypeptidase